MKQSASYNGKHCCVNLFECREHLTVWVYGADGNRTSDLAGGTLQINYTLIQIGSDTSKPIAILKNIRLRDVHVVQYWHANQNISPEILCPVSYEDLMSEWQFE